MKSIKNNGATARDERDGDLTSQIKISGSVDYKKEGTYTITYTVKNSYGNEASVKRTVTVKNNQTSNKPTITLNGPATIEIEFGTGYNEHRSYG